MREHPPHFYPLLAASTPDFHVSRIVREHLTNDTKFCVRAAPSADGGFGAGAPPAAAEPLIQMWHPGMLDHSLCGSLECLKDTAGYSIVGTGDEQSKGYQIIRYEGILLSSEFSSRGAGSTSTHSDVRALYTWHSPSIRDTVLAPANWGAKNSGYQRVRLEGYAYTSAAPQRVSGSLPENGAVKKGVLIELQLWFNDERKDHQAVASEAGRNEVKNSGYKLVHSLGWVYPPPGVGPCRYGLPSVSKDDPEYHNQNYWQGRIWPPMIQIVYWALQEYDHLDSVRSARKGLVEQSHDLLRFEWNKHHYIHEQQNADSGRGCDGRSESQPMYSWGALAGFIAIQEQGLYHKETPRTKNTDTAQIEIREDSKNVIQ